MRSTERLTIASLLVVGSMSASCATAHSPPSVSPASIPVAPGTRNLKTNNTHPLQLPDDLGKLLAAPTDFDKFLDRADKKAGPQTPAVITVPKDGSCGVADQAVIVTRSFATAGAMSYSDLTFGKGFLVADIQNIGSCRANPSLAPFALPLNTRILIFVAKDGGAYNIHLVNPATHSELAGYTPTLFASWPPATSDDASHPMWGDHGGPKSAASICDHNPPGFRMTADHKLYVFDDITDAWTMWFACSDECCHA